MEKSSGQRKSILSEAETLVNGPRRDSYGDVKESFVRLARLFTEVLGKKLLAPVTPHECGLLLVALKLSREINKPDRENRLDGAAYFDLADQVADIDCDGKMRIPPELQFAVNNGDQKKK